MPIYEYVCQDCKHKFSFLHKRLGEAAPPCPQCQSSQVKKVFSTFAPQTGAPACANAPFCPNAQQEHHCCPGCCHHH